VISFSLTDEERELRRQIVATYLEHGWKERPR
jgi:hypothetical protein